MKKQTSEKDYEQQKFSQWSFSSSVLTGEGESESERERVRCKASSFSFSFFFSGYYKSVHYFRVNCHFLTENRDNKRELKIQVYLTSES